MSGCTFEHLAVLLLLEALYEIELAFRLKHWGEPISRYKFWKSTVDEYQVHYRAMEGSPPELLLLKVTFPYSD